LLEKVPLDKASSFLNKAQLMKLRLKAMRAGVWFRALPRIDRALVDLTIRVASSIRSVTLAKNILVVVRKLEGVLESVFSRAFREVGFPLARKLSLVAQAWGYASAVGWSSDLSFVKFLAVMYINGPETFKT
jgi:hypothetical protein